MEIVTYDQLNPLKTKVNLLVAIHAQNGKIRPQY